MEHAMVETPGRGKTRFEKDVHHSAVLAEDVGVKRSNSGTPADFRKAFQHPRADATPPPAVSDRERDLRSICLSSQVVAGGGDDGASVLGYEHALPFRINAHHFLGLVPIDPRHAQKTVIERVL